MANLKFWSSSKTSGRSGWPRTPPFAYLATLPTILMVLLIVGFPLVYSLWLALHKSNPITKKSKFVGFDNFLAILSDQSYWNAFYNTAYFVGFSLVFTTLLGIVIARVLHKSFSGRGFMRSVMLLPWAMAPVTIGILWSFIYAGDVGTLNALLHDIGLSAWTNTWLGNGDRALTLVSLTHVWNQTPLTALLILAGLQSMPVSLHKAAMLDGADPITRFFKITLPWLKPTLLFITIIATINALMAFDIIWTMTRGGPGESTTVFAWLGYIYSFQLLKLGLGAAMLYILTALSFCLAIIYVVVLGQRYSKQNKTASIDVVHSDMSFRTPRPHTMQAPVLKKPFLSPEVRKVLSSFGFWVMVVLIFTWSALPVLMLGIMSATPPSDLIRIPPSIIPSRFTFENFQTILNWSGSNQTVKYSSPEVGVLAKRVPLSIQSSFIVGAVSVSIALALTPFAGYAFARWPRSRAIQAGLWGMLFTRMTPALVLLLPFFVLYRTIGINDTRTGLIVAHLSILLPLFAWMMKSTFESVPRSLDSAAKIDGCSHFQMMIRVMLPVIRPGLMAAAIFGFLVSWNEFLFAVILTSNPNTQTIPVVLSSFLAQVRYHEYGPMFAASVVSILPPVIVAFIFQRYLIQGALSGAVKG